MLTKKTFLGTILLLIAWEIFLYALCKNIYPTRFNKPSEYSGGMYTYYNVELIYNERLSFTLHLFLGALILAVAGITYIRRKI